MTTSADADAGTSPDRREATDVRGPRAFDAEHRASTIGLLALVTMFAFEAVAVSLAMPSVARSLDGTTLYPIAVVGLITAAVPGMVIGGRWSDARGAGAPLLVGGIGFVVGLVVSGVAGTMEVFVAGRLLQGLASGLALTALYVAVGDAFPASLRARVFSLFSTAWVLPSIVGPLVAGALVDLAGWRSVFLVVAAFAALATVFVRVSLGRRLVTRRRPLAWGRGPLYAVVAALAATALHLAGHAGTGRSVHQAPGPVTWLLLVAALAVLGLVLPSLLPVGTFRARPGLPAVVAARGLIGAAFAGVEMFVPLVLQDESGLSPTASGLVMMVGALGWTAGATYAGRRSARGSFAPVLHGGALSLLAGALVMLAVVPLEHRTGPAVLVAGVGFTLMGLGMGLSTPLLSTLALDQAEDGRTGDAGSAVQMSDALGQGVAAGLVGAVFARWYLLDPGTSYFSAFGLAALLGLAAVGVMARVGRRPPAPDHRAG